MTHQRALADARLADHTHHHGLTTATVVERLPQRHELPAPTHEGTALRGQRLRARPWLRRVEQRTELFGPRASLGIALEQGEADAIEILRHAEGERRRRGRRGLHLLREHLERRAFEGQATGERLEEHHAERVPIGRGGVASAPCACSGDM